MPAPRKRAASHARAERGRYRKKDIDHAHNGLIVLGNQNDPDIRIGDDARKPAALSRFIRREFALLRKQFAQQQRERRNVGRRGGGDMHGKPTPSFVREDRQIRGVSC
jgi:hypothetical protein